ncbi:MAG TPA: DUF1634 domain-containing protein [Edaphobacter sp.]|uniref:DUF1634 domain-containing protein n=1 Tax=Edaphobacter sp. TaxID=1934404 RepID=UPI002C993598|nr:DUF1634 domain-containing protein [Edaphobacter sp.]HUZ94324.1 DUF1634 domain-containing protein [Edaphobacter sp.]
MNLRNSKFDDQKMETIMGRLLQIGVLLASAVVLAGGAFYVYAHLGTTVDYRTFAGEPSGFRTPKGLWHLLMQGNSAAIIQAGVILLIATPVARVVFAVIGFAIERDRLYVAVSLTVLAVLMASLIYSS